MLFINTYILLFLIKVMKYDMQSYTQNPGKGGGGGGGGLEATPDLNFLEKEMNTLQINTPILLFTSKIL